MPPLQTRIFVGFWNVQLSIIENVGDEYRLDWKQLSPFLVQEATDLLGTQLQFEGTNVYVSYNPKSQQDRKLRHWCTNTLDGFPGVRVIMKERKFRGAPVCPDCHKRIDTCPHCNGKMQRTIEKGIDTAIVTDMTSLAWEDAWEVSILASSDRDFIPAVEFLTTKGLRVVNTYFRPKGMHLARTCWASIDLIPHLPDLSR